MSLLGSASYQRSPPLPAAVAASRHGGLAAALQKRLGSRAAVQHRPSSTSRAQLLPAAVAAGAQAAQQQQQQQPPRHSRLKDPAKLSASMQASVPVPDRGGAISLDKYMRLPPEQYNELDPAMIKALGGSSFLLKVPRMTLFNVWVEPEVVVSVRVADGSPGVIFEAGECTLRGSDLLNQLGLDRRFVLYFHTMLTWQPGSKAASMPGAAPSSSSALSNGSGMGAIHAKADVQVWTEGTGNTVVGALLQALLPIFMNLLAEDYKRWSTDAAYRARRAAAPRQAAPLP
ncbi:hypothetical protein CHLNCDRAFT_54801 [Chlorella variabilis]|uniref:Uncharacterized protein n=1 Tax=Chlorella variabilis TaxID=554065 RepID=E1ZQK0_CHLVA|nr:hypothetical protein CHLNCDRAFT_54801 [Chlorella variabilis]EFN52028.1 hypothetical protein CHLNCDRAFT_54801 [Chlorella variabilis]|eukprot:XP_005844130.1 hypothetical protein CHLNCDRAFT_54801 [Chlorella variabilis]